MITSKTRSAERTPGLLGPGTFVDKADPPKEDAAPLVMQVTVRAFAILREKLGGDTLLVTLRPDESAASLFARLFPDRPDASWSQSLLIAVNREVVPPSTILRDGDEVAFLPPLGGGSGTPDRRVSLSETQLDLDETVRRVSDPDRGGIAVFLGTVRDHFEGRAVVHLEYEAYPEMALAEMTRLCDEIEGRWPGCAVAISHRTGRLSIGDCAVVVAAAAPHRAEAFLACRHGIDELKMRVPIWKKELYSDGASWRENPRD